MKTTTKKMELGDSKLAKVRLNMKSRLSTAKALILTVCISLGLSQAGMTQTYTEVFRYGLPTIPSANSKLGLDQSGRITWSAVENGSIRNVQFTRAKLNALVYQKIISGRQVTGLYNYDDGTMVMASTVLNAKGQEITSLTQFPLDGLATHTLLLAGLAKTTIDPAGYIISLVKPLNGGVPTLTRYNQLLGQDWTVAVKTIGPATFDSKAAIDRYQIASDSNGNLYPSIPILYPAPSKLTPNRIFKYTPGGSLSPSWSNPVGYRDFTDIKAMVGTPEGSLYLLVQTATNYALNKLNGNGKFATKSDGKAWSFLFPSGKVVGQLSVDREGNPSVIDPSAKEILKFGSVSGLYAPAPISGSGVVVDDSDPRYVYRAYTLVDSAKKQGAVLEKYDVLLKKSLNSSLIVQGHDVLAVQDLKVDWGGNVIMSVLYGDLNATTKAYDYRSTVILLNQTTQSDRQVSKFTALFAAKGKSVYDPKLAMPPFNVDLAKLSVPTQAIKLGRSGNVSIKAGPVYVSLGQFGAKLDGTIKGEVGVKATISGSLGRFNLSYPIQLLVDAPAKSDATMAPNKKFRVRLSYAPSSLAMMSTEPSELYALLTGRVALTGKSSLTAVGYDRQLVSAKFFDTTFDKSFTLFDTQKFASSPYAFSQSNLTGTGQIPRIQTHGKIANLVGGDYTISTSGSDSFFSARASLTDLVPGQAQVKFDSDFTDLGKLKGQIGSSTANFSGKLKQNFVFTPGAPVVSFVDATGAAVKFDESAVGEIAIPTTGVELTFTMPASGSLTLYPVIKLPNAQFQSRSILDTVPGTSFSLFKGTSRLTYQKYPLWMGAWDLQNTLPVTQVQSTELANRTFKTDSLGVTKGPRMVIVGNGGMLTPGVNSLRPSIIALSRPALKMFILNQELVGQPANYSRARREFERFVTDTTTMTVTGTNFLSKTTKFYLTHLGRRYDLSNQVNIKVNGGVRFDSSTSVALYIPNYFMVLPGTAVLTAEDSVSGVSNTVGIPIEVPHPNVSTVGPNLWASDPQSKEVYITVTDARDSRSSDTFFARRDYYYQLDRLWTDVFTNLDVPASLTSLTGFFPESGIKKDATTYNQPTMPIIRWKVAEVTMPLLTYGEPVPSGLLWAVLPQTYFGVASPINVSLEVSGQADGISSDLDASVSAPQPVISSLDPPTVSPASGTFTLTVNGPSNVDPPGNNQKRGNFNPESVVNVGGVALPTTFVSSSKLTVQVSPASISGRQSVAVTVTNPAKGTTYFEGGAYKTSGGTSPAALLTISSPVPALTSVSPAKVTTGFFNSANVSTDSATPNFAVSGTGFTDKSAIYIDGTAVATTFNSSELLTATLSAQVSASAGSRKIEVKTNDPNGLIQGSNSINLTVADPPTLNSLTVDRAQLAGGKSFIVSATASEPAPGEGIWGTLTSSNEAVIPSPGQIVVSSTQSAVQQLVVTNKVTTATTVTLTLTQPFGETRVATVTVVPLGMNSVTFAQDSLKGGDETVGTVTITDPAPVGGAKVKLSSANSLVYVLSEVIIPEGAKSATFACKTSSLDASAPIAVSLSATYNGTEAIGTLTVLPLELLDFSLSEGIINHGDTTTFTVELSQPAPTDIYVPIACSDVTSQYILDLQPTIYVASGSRFGKLTITTSGSFLGDFPFLGDFTATYQGKTLKVWLLIK